LKTTTPVRWPKCTASQFAELLGVSVQTVTAWIDAGMPCARGRGRGHAVEITPGLALPWVVWRREPKGSQRERLAKEQADKVAIENAVKRGELIFASQVAEVFSTLSADLASRHDAVPGRLASELAGINEPAVVRERLLDDLRSVRAAFADAIEKLADVLESAEDDGGDPAPAEETDREPVGKRKPRPAGRKRRARSVAKR